MEPSKKLTGSSLTVSPKKSDHRWSDFFARHQHRSSNLRNGKFRRRGYARAVLGVSVFSRAFRERLPRVSLLAQKQHVLIVGHCVLLEKNTPPTRSRAGHQVATDGAGREEMASEKRKPARAGCGLVVALDALASRMGKFYPSCLTIVNCFRHKI